MEALGMAEVTHEKKEQNDGSLKYVIVHPAYALMFIV